MIKSILNELDELNEQLSNFDKSDVLLYKLLLIKAYKITLFFEDNDLSGDEKAQIINAFNISINHFKIKKMLVIQDLNEIFQTDQDEIDIENINIYITLLNILMQEWESNDNIFSIKLKNTIKFIIDKINSSLNNEFNIQTPIFINNKDSEKEKNIENDERKTLNNQIYLFNNNDNNEIEIKNKDYLREYIIQKRLLKYECSCCGISSWQNNPIILYLYSKNGIYSNKHLEQLEFLYPKCNSQLGD